MPIRIEPIQTEDRSFISGVVRDKWGDEPIVVHGEVFHTTDLDGVKAIKDGQIVGFLHYQITNKEFEILTLASLVERHGVGSALIEAAERIAHDKGCQIISVVTTNDNLHALGFYQKRGFHLAAIFPGSVNLSREIKPAIPEIGENNIPIRDEIRLEKPISQTIEK